MDSIATGELDAVVAAHHLNDHPFYRAWRAGTLPRAALSAYAVDYAPFIRAIEAGWRTLGDTDHAAEECEHARLWDRFREAVGAPKPEDERPNARAEALAEYARGAFADPVEALGALYAFEAQQPSTARSKLEGLREHYGLSDDQTVYFRLHADDYGERDRLARRAERLTPSELAIARGACEKTCLAMWSALDGCLLPSESAA